jgi:hypothetical protein
MLWRSNRIQYGLPGRILVVLCISARLTGVHDNFLNNYEVPFLDSKLTDDSIST